MVSCFRDVEEINNFVRILYRDVGILYYRSAEADIVRSVRLLLERRKCL
jgi:hypothetical protein